MWAMIRAKTMNPRIVVTPDRIVALQSARSVMDLTYQVLSASWKSPAAKRANSSIAIKAHLVVEHAIRARVRLGRYLSRDAHGIA